MPTPKKAITPKKIKETKKPSTKPIPPKKTQKTKRPSTPKKNTRQPKKPSIKTKRSNGNVSEYDVVVVSPSRSESQGGTERNVAKITETPTSKSKKSNQKRKQKEEEEEVKAYTFPMERVRRIIRSEDSDLRISHDAVLLVNKATEKFLEKFCEDALACCMKDRKKSLAYKHLSSVVSKQKRYDFLSDYVPEKVKAEDALAKRKSAEAKAV